MVFPTPLRARNAAATRAALLESARGRFASSGYDATSLRDVASDAGVDAALVCRYFGSKEELFAEVLGSMDDSEWLRRDQADFGRTMAADLVAGCEDDGDLNCIMVLMRSIGSAKAHAMLREWGDASFHHPLRDVLAGDDADVRARLAGALMLGVSISRAIDPNFGLDEAQRQRFTERLADLLQACVAT